MQGVELLLQCKHCMVHLEMLNEQERSIALGEKCSLTYGAPKEPIWLAWHQKPSAPISRIKGVHEKMHMFILCTLYTDRWTYMYVL